jgi:hypothetical protein
MTPDEAFRHEWLQPNSSSATFIITSTSTSSLTKHSRDQVKENDHDYAPILQKLQRSQPITPLTILPQIKTPSHHASHYNNNNITKDSNKIKGEYFIHTFLQNRNLINCFLIIVLTTSTSELEQQKLYQRQTVRKLSTQLNNNPMQQSANSNTSSSSSSSLTGSGSGKYGVSHSHSTGDMSAIFGRA